MKLPISKSDYRLNPKTNVWSRPDYIGIAYSDGDEVEQRIAAVIEQASDLTVLSTELRQHCIDWPSLYHFSGTRSNILRPFQRTLAGAEVLEIGAGCGAITRYLGECGANVLALEGSPRRAAIARSRTRGLPNVMVVADRFDQFDWDQKFDFISLIGVLEYANLFTPAGDPALAMLQRVRAMLKPDGKLIIAIENQLGLKYFAGATEDHLGQPMVGIEGRYQKDQPQTWGRKVLTDMLEKAGFATSKFLAPFPDYKLPVSILTEEGFLNKKFDAAAFAWQSVRLDPQLPAYCNFSLELAWPEVFQNELGLDVANSFLIIASPKAKKLIPTGVLTYHYSVGRIPAYCKETVFIRSDGGDIRAEYRRLGTPEDADKANNPLIKFVLPDSDDYVFGRPLSLEFFSIVTRDGWTFDQVARFILRYFSIVETFAKSAGIQIKMTSPYAELPGKFFDVIPQNIIIHEDDSFSLIDKEWQLANPIEVAYLLFRSFLPLINSITRFGRPVSKASMTCYQFIDGTFAAAGLRLQEGDYARYIKLEADIQQSVTGHASENFSTWLKNYPLPILNLSQALAERDGQIVSLNQAVAERDRTVQTLTEQVAEKDAAVSERDAQITELTAETIRRGEWSLGGLEARLKEVRGRLTAITHSKSWQLILPLREMRRWVLIPKLQVKRYAKSILGLDKRINGFLPLEFKKKFLYKFLLNKFPEKFKPSSKMPFKKVAWSPSIDSSARVSLQTLMTKLNIPGDATIVLSALKDTFGEDRYKEIIEDYNTLDQMSELFTDRTVYPLVQASELPEISGNSRRRRILFITSLFPSPHHGGGNRVLNFIKILSENNDIYLSTFYFPKEDDEFLKIVAPYCCSIQKIQYFDFGGNQAEIHKWLNGMRMDIIHYEWPLSLLNYDRAFGEYHIFTYMEAVSLRLSMDLQCIEPLSEVWLDKIAELFLNLRIELANASLTHARIAVTTKDGNFFKNFLPYQEYAVLNHGLTFDEFVIPDVEPEPNTLVFVGNYGHPPNEEAMVYFFNEIWEGIRKEVPEVRIYVVGVKPSKQIKRLADSRHIFVTGSVPDVRTYIQKATICIAPLISGAGLRGKVIEYAALRRTFVATSIATTDLVFRDGIDYLCADTAADFTRKIILMLKNEQMTRQMGDSAFDLARKNYDTRRLVDFLNRLYNRLETS